MAAVIVAATMAESEVYAESAAVAAVVARVMMAGVAMATVVTAVTTSTPCKSVIDKAESEQRHRQCDSRQYIS